MREYILRVDQKDAGLRLDIFLSEYFKTQGEGLSRTHLQQMLISGKVILEGASLPEGTVVTIFAKDSEAKVRLPPALQAELEEALEEADREEGISGDELLEKLRKYD